MQQLISRPTLLLLLLLLPLLLPLLQPAAAVVADIDDQSLNETAARIWFDQFDREKGQKLNRVGNARWNNAINITKENQQIVQEAALSLAEFSKAKAREVRQTFRWQEFKDPDLRRKFKAASTMGSDAANETMQKLLSELSAEQNRIYSTAKVRDPITGKMINLDPDITRLLGDRSVSEPQKRQLWQEWREQSGRRMRDTYVKFVQTLNSMVRQDGYKDVTDFWQQYYEPKEGQNFEAMMAKLWDQVLPLYKQLHAYVRRRLREKYPAEIFPPTGQIPAHILGNMWAQGWLNIERDTVPFPDQIAVDVSEEMRRQNWTVHRMVRASEEFFTSLGLKNMTDAFWQKSVFERRPNVEMVCHASAWDFFTGSGDFRIKQCTTIDVQYLATTHHEMGHIQYYQQYEHQPVVFRTGGNPGFHEAIGDIMELSVLTPEHLRKIGLLKETIDNKEYYINYLYQMALSKISFLPFGYLIDQWRWRVFDGTVQPQEYNHFWWKLRCGLQGVSSPVKRTAQDFDPGAKYHVPSNTPYIRYFVSHVLQFQLHEALCKAAGFKGELYKCDIYQSREAGVVMEKLMQPGKSEHWEEILYKAIGTREISAEPLLRYFKELQDFLERDNREHKVTVGWKDECPADEWYDNGAAGFGFVSSLLTLWAVLCSMLLRSVCY